MTAADPELTSLPPLRALWLVAWPVVVIGLIRAAYYIVDAWWVGKLGEVPLVALGAASFGWWIVLQVSSVGGTGIHALVAQEEGAGKREAAESILVQGLWVGVALWVLIVGTAPWWSEAYFVAMGVGGEAAGHGGDWLMAVAIGSLATIGHGGVDAVFRGLGRTDLALRVVALGLVLNGLLDPVFMWGWGPVPAFGLPGAAWATAASDLLAMLLGLWWLRGLDVLPRWAMPGGGWPRRIAAIGTPIAVSGVGFSLVYVVLGRVIAEFGEEQVAALGIGHRLESIPYLTAVGIMVGTSTLVGQHVGAGSPDRAAQAARTSAWVSVVAMAAFTVVGLVIAEPAFALFSEDPVLIDAGVTYLRIQALVWVFMAVEVVFEGAFAGVGHTMPALVISAAGSVLRIPLALLGAWSLGWGVTGVWVAIAVSTLVKGVVMAWWFERGTWRVETPPSHVTP